MRNKSIKVTGIVGVVSLSYSILVLNKGFFNSIVYTLLSIVAVHFLMLLFTITLEAFSKELMFTNTKNKRDFLRIFSKITYGEEPEFYFEPTLENLSLLPEFKSIFPEGTKISNLYSDCLEGTILFNTEEFIEYLTEVYYNSKNVEEYALYQVAYSSDSFKDSLRKKAIYIDNFNYKFLTFLKDSKFKILVDNKELVSKYPNYSTELSKTLMLGTDSYGDYQKVIVEFTGDYEEFFEIVFSNVENSKKKQGYIALEKILLEKVNDVEVKNTEDFLELLSKIKI